jgi:hypothetical protein
MMREITGNNGIFWDFGSNRRDWHCDDMDSFFEGVAQIIVGKLQSEMGINMKTHFRKFFNLDYIFRHQLEPAMFSLLNDTI